MRPLPFRFSRGVHWPNWEARGLDTPIYESPTVTDYGDLQELTANNAIPQFVDVPQGTPVGTDPIVGNDPFPEMS